MFKNCFERKEKKYMLTKAEAKYFLAATKDLLQQDQYGRHTIISIYLDTEDYKLIRNSIEKPEYKEKIRLRSYGSATKNSPVYLELKKKFQGTTYKRRICLSYAEAINYLTKGIPPAENGQIFKEIDWFIKNNNYPSPKAVISCDRIALFETTNPDIRVTLDFDIRWRNYNFGLASSEGARLTDPSQCLMEIKIPDAMPLYLSRLLSDMEIFPTSFSKYGTAYKTKLFGEEKMKYVV